jgi:hypothetical protein
MYRAPEFSEGEWEPFIRDARKVLDASGIKLRHYTEGGQPAMGYYADEDNLRFDGMPGEACETMFFDRVHESEFTQTNEDGLVFTFCKTREYPYDTCVTAIMLLAKHFFPGKIELSTDGDRQDWEAGRELIENALCRYTEWVEEGIGLYILEPKDVGFQVKESTEPVATNHLGLEDGE